MTHTARRRSPRARGPCGRETCGGCGSTGACQGAQRGVCGVSLDEVEYSYRGLRAANWNSLQELYLGHALAHGLVFTDDARTSVAAFLPPDAPELPGELQEVVGELHGDRLSRLLELSLPQGPTEAWSLATVGVSPASQGRGLGSAVAEQDCTALLPLTSGTPRYRSRRLPRTTFGCTCGSASLSTRRRRCLTARSSTR